MALLNDKISSKDVIEYIVPWSLTVVIVLLAISTSSLGLINMFIKFESLEPFCRLLFPLSGSNTVCMTTLLPTTTTMAATQSLYHISGLDDLVLGRSIPLSTRMNYSEPTHRVPGYSSMWRFPPGTYTPKQIVEQVSPLFESLLIQLGRDPPGATPSRKILLDGLRSCLSLDGRESTLPLSKWANSTGNSARKEISSQAQRIGSLLVRYAQEASPPVTVNPQLSIRSPCEGHVWSRDVAGLLIGPRSNGNLMQVYNEWLHQIVLLRDGLLPFEIFDKVELVVKPDLSQGTRPLESIRPQLLMQIMSAQVKRTTLLDVAKVLMAPDLPSGGYGFQYARGVVMPTLLLTGSSSILLRYIPAIIDDSQQQELLFDYEKKDYFSVPRDEVGAPAETLLGTASASAAEDSSITS